VNKAELIDRLAARLDTSKKEAAEILDAIIDEITGAVAKGEKVALTGFGVFEKAFRAARTGRNPLTGEPVKISATSVPKFRPGADFKATVAGGKKPAKKAPAKKAAAKKK
jgi:DNA-binding protein HU-beta